MSDFGFFETLGHIGRSSQPENQLTRTFQACFNYSLGFRKTVLKTLSSACSLRGALLHPEHWRCNVFPSSPKEGGGYPDIRLWDTVGRHDGKPIPDFVLESKVGAPLKSEQLEKYRSSGIERLVAITKNPPECSKQEVIDLGAYTLRWQDIHRALRSDHQGRSIDSFIAQEFVKYLEDNNMAYREQLSLNDLNRIGKLFQKISLPTRELNPRGAFNAADRCLKMLADLQREFMDSRPALKKAHRWTPAYFNTWDENRPSYHALGWAFYWKHYENRRFGCRIYFPQDTDKHISWAVQYFNRKTDPEPVESERRISSYFTKGYLDAQKLLKSIDDFARKWGI
jgi:hypothetical protein